MAKKKNSGKSAEREKEEDIQSRESKRMNRLMGQLEGVRNMLRDGRPAQDILTQCKAVHAGLRAIEVRLLEEHVLRTLEDFSDAGRKERGRLVEELLKLYKPAG